MVHFGKKNHLFACTCEIQNIWNVSVYLVTEMELISWELRKKKFWFHIIWSSCFFRACFMGSMMDPKNLLWNRIDIQKTSIYQINYIWLELSNRACFQMIHSRLQDLIISLDLRKLKPAWECVGPKYKLDLGCKI